jgi:hypothetical protein
MLQQVWTCENRRLTVCVDSYENGVLQGRFYNASQEMESFESLMQFLHGVEMALENQQMPQSFTTLRKFSDLIPRREASVASGSIRKGKIATFEMHVLFRQHTSWQGQIIWRERQMEQSFRSALELVLLMDSALRSQKEVVA